MNKLDQALWDHIAKTNKKFTQEEGVVGFKEVIIQIMGGVAEVVQCPNGVKVTIIDHDIEE